MKLFVIKNSIIDSGRLFTNNNLLVFCVACLTFFSNPIVKLSVPVLIYVCKVKDDSDESF